MGKANQKDGKMRKKAKKATHLFPLSIVNQMELLLRVLGFEDPPEFSTPGKLSGSHVMLSGGPVRPLSGSCLAEVVMCFSL